MENFQLNVPAYLERIECREPIPLTVEGLHLLTRAHLCHVPFENLALTDEHLEPSLEPEALFHKIVEQKRGGYCFELNKLFALLLTEIGFACRSVAARVINNRPEPCAISHRAIVVTIDGKRYFCDVGFGGEGPRDILPLDEGPEQTVAGERFHLSFGENSIVVSKYKDGGLWRVLRFEDTPWLDVDFVSLNRYFATYPRSPFLQKRILYITTEDGWKALVDRTFTRVSEGTYHTTEVEADQVKNLIQTEFRLNLPVDFLT